MLRKILRFLRPSPSGRGKTGHRPPYRAALEVLEGRLTPAVLTVNTLADQATADSVLSLREAISVVDAGSTAGLSAAEQAQVSGTLGSDDTIQFAPSLAGGTITLTGGALNITRAVAITGPGSASLTVSGGGSGRVFVVGQIFTQNLGLDVAISGLTITGGSAAYGGGVLNFGTLALSNDALSNNAATDAGGGVYNVGALTLNGCTFTGNTVSGGGNGGGVQNNGSGSLTVANCTFTGNTAPRGGQGAGLGNSGTATVTASTFSGNTAGSNGGGIYNDCDGMLTVGNSTFANNAGGSDGGGIDQDGTATITASTLSGNSAGSEGGAMDSRGPLTLINCTVYGNTAVSTGGGLTTSASARITNCTITANRVTVGSGGVFGGGLAEEGIAAQLFNTIVAGNFQGATGIAANDVAGTLASASASNLIGTGGSGGLGNGVNGNQVGVSNPGLGGLADNGGPTQTVLTQPGSPALAAGSTAFVTPGETDQRGLPRVVNGAVDIGAVQTQVIIVETPAVLTVNSLADNTTADNVLTLREAIALVDGTLGRPLTAAEQAQVSGTLGFDDTIQFNLSPGPQTITLTQGALDITKDVTITGPGAGNLTITGGGSDRVFVVGQSSPQNPGLDVAISGLTITGGSAAYGAGLLNFGTLALSNDVISNNAATDGSGGGIYNGGALTLTACTLSGNTTQGSSSTAGGGLDNVTGGTVMATGCTFSGNIAGGSGTAASDGGAVANSGPMTLTGCTFSNNQAASDGGAIYSYGTLTIGTTAFSNNSAGSDGGAIRSGDSSLTVTASTFSGNTAASLGGALTITSSAAALTNCTLYGNTAGTNAGALWAEVKGPGTLTNVTITANRVTNGSPGSFGGGVFARLPVTLDNTVVAGNLKGGTGSTADDVAGALDPASAFNLIGAGGSGGLSSGVNHNQVGVSNPGLATLADNGGPTQTVLLLPGSPALAGGSTAFVTPGETDQRGLARIVNGAVDIGAVEVQTTATPPANQSGTAGQSTPFTLGSFADADAAAGPWSVDVNWGDGSGDTTFTAAVQGLLGTRAHTYPGAGTFTVVVTVTDTNHDAGRITFPITVTPLAAPSNLTAVAVSATQVNLSWADNAGGQEAGFKLYRSTDQVNWTWFDTAGPGVTASSWYSAAPSTTYYFRVTAYNAAGDSAPSNTATVTTPAVPAAPGGLTAVAVSATQVNLSWADNAGGQESGFKLYRSTDQVNWTWFDTAGPGVTASSWYGAAPSTTYYFRVTAYNAAGDSAPSNTATVTTLALPASQAEPLGFSSREMSRWPRHSHARHGHARPAGHQTRDVRHTRDRPAGHHRRDDGADQLHAGQ